MHRKLINILLVDDDPADRRLVKLTLAKSVEPVSFAVETVSSLAEGLKQLETHSFDLLLLDLGLPDSRGLETVDKAHRAHPDIPIVVLTGLADEETGLEAIKTGANDYLVKDNLLKDLLVRSIRYSLERKDIERQLQAGKAKLLSVNADLQKEVARRRQAYRELTGRVKELNCLYGLSNLIEQPGISTAEIFQKTGDLIRNVWQYPQFVCVRITFADNEYKTDNFKTTRWKQCAQIKVDSREAGGVEVFYLDEEIKSDQSPFLKEEKALIEAVAERLGKVIEHKQSEERYRSLMDDVLDNSEVGMFILDADFKVVWVNKAMERYFGLQRDKIVGKDKRQLIRKQIKDIFEDPQTFVDRVLATYDNNSYVENFEVHVLPDGHRKERWLEHKSHPIKTGLYAGGRIEHYYDITERKQAEQARRKIEVQLRQSQKLEAIGTLAGGIAHDFNNILSAITGYADLALQDVPAGTVAHDNLKQVLIGANRAKNLVRQILLFSSEAEQQLKPIEIAPVVEEALKFLMSSLPATINLRDNIQATSSVILGDATQIHQVLMNLCTNAAHAMQGNCGLLEVSLTDINLAADITKNYPNLQPGPHVRLSVTDTGTGMEPEVMQRIFEPFFTTKQVGRGVGMGLAVVHGIVEKHRGAITVDSQPGKGTTFNIYLPKIDSIAIQNQTSVLMPGNGEMILVVDDEEALVNMTKQTLSRLGYTVVGKTSSTAALQAFRKAPHKFDLVIADYAMPDMAGAQLAEELMSIRPDIPVVLCTGFSEDIDAAGARAIGIRDFLIKPVTKENLARIIRRILDKKEVNV